MSDGWPVVGEMLVDLFRYPRCRGKVGLLKLQSQASIGSDRRRQTLHRSPGRNPARGWMIDRLVVSAPPRDETSRHDGTLSHRIALAVDASQARHDQDAALQV